MPIGTTLVSDKLFWSELDYEQMKLFHRHHNKEYFAIRDKRDNCDDKFPQLKATITKGGKYKLFEISVASNTEGNFTYGQSNKCWSWLDCPLEVKI